MSNSGRNLPKEIIDQWPEVFGEVKLHVVPLQYLQTVLVTFKDGKCWEIPLSSLDKKNSWEEFEKSLSELIQTYEKNIDSVDFKLDVEQVKKDIKKKTNRFLKKKAI